MSEFVSPALLMQAATLPSGGDWSFEQKFDGFRGQVSVDTNGKVTIRTRTGRDWTTRFPQIASELERLHSPPMVLDGELVAFDSRGESDFRKLCRGLNHGAEASFVAFDLLAYKGSSVLGVSLAHRRQMLEAIFERSRPPHLIVASVLDDGRALLADVERRGGEGIVAKRCSSLYAAGQRTSDWLKIKCVRRDDFVIVGWHPAPDNTLSSIVVASPDKRGLHFRGSVGSGFSRAERLRLPTLLQDFEVEIAPCASARPVRSRIRWVKPVLRAELRYDAITGDGALRGAAFLGIRDDLSGR